MRAALAPAWAPQWLRTVVGGLLVLGAGYAGCAVAGLPTPSYVVTLGALLGLGYGLLAVCLVLVYRTTRVVNFAQSATGALAAVVLGTLTKIAGVPYWIAFALACAAGFALGALTELTVIRRLAKAPRVVVTVATLGTAVVMADLAREVSYARPTPPGLFEFTLGPLLLTREYTGIILAAPVLVVALTLFLTRTRFGLAIRASASNPEAAVMAGIPIAAMTATAWGIAGVCATVLTVFSQVDTAPDPGLFTQTGLLPALTAAAVARMSNFARALVAGVLLGIVEQVMQWSDLTTWVNTAMLMITFVALLFLHQARGREDSAQSWGAVATVVPLPEPLARLWTVRAIPVVLGVGTLIGVCWLATASTPAAITWSTVIAIALIAASTALVVSLVGDLSLGQYACAGVGGIATYTAVSRTGDQFLAAGAAVLAGAAVCVLLAYPALRVGGLVLTMLTIQFAAMLPDTVLLPSWGSSGTPVGQPVIAGVSFADSRLYFWWSLGIGLVGLLLARNIWRGSFGRRAVAARDNIHAARSFGVNPLRTRLQVFACAGGLAGLAGMLIVQQGQAVPSAFAADNGALIVLAPVLGGVAAYSGSILGTLWIFAIPMLSEPTASGQTPAALAAYAGAMALILASPGGAAQLLVPVRDALAMQLGRLHGVRLTWRQVRGDAGSITEEPAVAAPTAGTPPSLRPTWTLPEVHPDRVLLEARSIAVSFGGVHAVRDVSLSVREGEIVGLIGPNGAGKTTTFDMLSGFVRPTAGSVHFEGEDVTRCPPERLVGRGLVRSFQNADLFPTMTVLDVVDLSLEQDLRSSVPLSVLGLDHRAQRRRRVATELVDFFGLGNYATRRVSELSTGTRRIVELACLFAMRPRLLLLDEPSSGIAQRETEALGSYLKQMQREFAVTIVLIEHDIPLVMSLSDRVVAMTEGRVLMTGTPHEVRTDDRVIDAYLGVNETTINRSDTVTKAEAHR